MDKITSSEYIEKERREFSLYTLTSRALPNITDGLKAAARRVMWTGRSGNKMKSAALAGENMKIHPHAAAESTIDTLAAYYGNNIPLLKGKGSFGTLLNPTAYGASRYTSVQTSTFAKDVLFADIEIIPMKDNYDSSTTEPVHFLPLVPLAMLNPTEGIAVGFAVDILPRTLDAIIHTQLEHLQNKKVHDTYPGFLPTNNVAVDSFEDEKLGKTRWIFRGEWTKTNAVTIKITNLPYGIRHDKWMAKLDKFKEDGRIVDIKDDSKNTYNITIKFKKGVLSKMTEEEIVKMLTLETSIPENVNVIDFDGQRVWSTNYVDLVTTFTTWRLGFYVQRYERLRDLLAVDIQRYRDILLAIKNNIGGIAKKIDSRSELTEFCADIGIVYTDYIADLSIYRFTESEKKKIEGKLADALAVMSDYEDILSSEARRTSIYVTELKNILKKYNKNEYTS